MFFMGIGSFVSKYIKKNLFDTFINIEIILGFFGGISATGLYLTYAYTSHYYLYNFAFIAILGALIGLEIPIVARIVNKYSSFKETVAKIFSFDYIGALAASVLFPLILLPWLGVIKTAFLIGIINLIIALYNAFLFRKLLKNGIKQSLISILLIAAFGTGMFFTSEIDDSLEQKIYQDKIIFSKQTKYQKLVLTRWNDDYRLFINGSIQFSSSDEYRYHETLVHLPMLLSGSREKILILGGGDGMVVREVLKYHDVEEIQLVDLDPEMTKLATENEIFRKLNKNSFLDKRVKVFNEDAYNFIKNSSEVYSTIIIDLPDPNDTGLGKLYTKEFYEMLSGRLSATGIIVSQSTSPYFAPKAYWCIYHTFENVFGRAIPYQTNVPTFGIWGFVMAGGGVNNIITQDTVNYKQKIQEKVSYKLKNTKTLSDLRYFSAEKLPAMFFFEKDTEEVNTKINTMSTQELVYYYNKSAEKWR